jgi:hypothetical protein
MLKQLASSSAGLKSLLPRKRERTVKRMMEGDEREMKCGTEDEEKCKKQAAMVFLYK